MTKENRGSASVIRNLNNLRSEIETAWDNITRYHCTTWSESDPISKGQCGVTSVLVARVLEQQGFAVMFCQGEVHFPGVIPPITNHCWLRMPSRGKHPTAESDIILDFTADQSGFDQPVVCDLYKSLIKSGIRYEERTEIKLIDIRSSGLLERVTLLEKRLNASHIKRIATFVMLFQALPMFKRQT